MSQHLYVGNIVEVCASGCIHFGKQGQIVGFDETDEKTPVRVWFGKEADYLIRYSFPHTVQLDKKYSTEPPPSSEQPKDPRTWSYAQQDLRVCSTWSMRTLAERHFEGMWHTYYEPKGLFVAGARDCDLEGCLNITTRRIIFNIWGSVCFADVCDTCASKYHLFCMDSFPWKKREAQVKTA